MLNILFNCKYYLSEIRKRTKALNILFFLSLLHCFHLPPLYSQAEISGVINRYSAVDSILNEQSLVVRDPSLFQPGDTVLLIQMKGLGIISVIEDDEEDTEYGKQNDINNAGNYEFLLIDAIEADTITFTREFMKEYNAFESAQLIRVRGYESATVTGTLTADPWDGEKGGILTFIVTNTLTLAADINVNSKGFRGGMPVARFNDECPEPGSDIYYEFSFPEGSGKAGEKGESAVTYYLDHDLNSFPLDSKFAEGRGRMAAGGGGGNGRFAGGGGGANWGMGGFGGAESAECNESQFNTEGIGGYRLTDQLRDTDGNYTNRFFLAGAGGGSTRYGSRIASRGGNGGGMVIIIANYIEGTEVYGIYADGESVNPAATAGAGGGGGGGTIVSSIDNYSGNIRLIARGGNGGDVNYGIMAGPGGGGGGGTVIHSWANLPGTAEIVVTPGAGGTNIPQNNPYGSTIGSAGGIIGELEISLNGLLFNGIKTSRDLICEDTAPDLIEGTQPRGGVITTGYIYEWFSRGEGEEPWTLIAGATEKDYQSGPLYETTQFIRVVKDNDPDQVIDTSRHITITVQPKITGNNIGDEQTICEGETPAELTGEAPVQGGNGVFEYKWIRSTLLSGEWSDAGNENTSLHYSPPALYDSTFYIRMAMSGVCIDSSNIVPVNVNPSIKDNYLGEDRTICHGDISQPLVPPVPVSGGSGSYIYTWETGFNDSWTIIEENGNLSSYDPGALFDSIQFRRTVESGACIDISPPLAINVLPLINGNTISDSQTICYLDSPELFTGPEPGGGDGIYRYLWELAPDAVLWSAADGDAGTRDYQAPPLSKYSYFRRIAYSGPDDVCKDTSNMIFIDFHPFSYASVIETSDTICVGEQIDLSFQLSGVGPWDLVFSDGHTDFSSEGISTVLFTYSVSPQSPDSTSCLYEVKSLTDRFGCSAPADNFEGTASIRVYAYPRPDPGTAAEVCGPVYQLNAIPSLGTGYWQTSSLMAEFTPDANRPDATVTVSDYGTHYFSWTEINWQCPATSEEIPVTFYEQPTSVYAGSDQNIHFIFETQLEAELPENMPEAYGEWTVVEGPGNIIFPGDLNTMVTNMGLGDNGFMWTVYNGVCQPVSDIVTVMVRDLNAPTGFSPNNSGYNDRFVIKGLENSGLNELTIFNRQGNVVYRTVNYQNDWEGRNHNGVPLPEDTYYYILTVDNKYSYKGFIVLKR